MSVGLFIYLLLIYFLIFESEMWFVCSYCFKRAEFVDCEAGGVVAWSWHIPHILGL